MGLDLLLGNPGYRGIVTLCAENVCLWNMKELFGSKCNGSRYGGAGSGMSASSAADINPCLSNA